MENYLERLCTNLGIKLVYTTNKYIVLSCSYKKDIPIIRVNEIFKGCSENLAIAIIEYYTNSKDPGENLKNIKEYLKVNFPNNQFKIQPPEEAFKELFTKNMPVEENGKGDLEQIGEYKISSIVQTNFYGDKSTIEEEGILKVSGDDILELDITVLPPLT